MVVNNLTNLTNVSSIPEFVKVANDSTQGLLIGLFIVAIFVVLIINFLKYDTLRALAGSSFACFILSILAFYMDWVNIIYVLIFLFLLAISGLLLYLEN